MEELEVGDKVFTVVERMHSPVSVTATVIEYGGKLQMAYFSDDCAETIIRDLMDGALAKWKWFLSARDAINEKTEQVNAKWRGDLAKHESLHPPHVAGDSPCVGSNG